MKKVLIAILAVVSLASCSKEQIIVTDRGAAIGFDTFIENATRAAADDFTSVSSFQVWGDVTGNIVDSNDDYIFLYNGANVTRDGAAWTCRQTEYWIPFATYNFLAIAGATSVDSTTTGAFPTTINYTADGATDLLLSDKVIVKTDGKSIPTGVNDNGCVPFTFKHLLSKVYFNFTNTSTSGNSTYTISDIKIAGAKKEGTYSIAEGWTSVSDDAVATPFSFGSVANTITKGASATSANACLFIPGDQNLIVSFTPIYNGNEDEPFSASLTRKFEANSCYVINVELKGGMPISFTVEQDGLGGWDNKTDISIP